MMTEKDCPPLPKNQVIFLFLRITFKDSFPLP